jgi:hypothetical protein
VGPACDVLARRIAHNRELAGVHFPSDAVASKYAADAAIKLLLKLPEFMALIAAVREEWGTPVSATAPSIPALSKPTSLSPPAGGVSPGSVPA